MNEFNELYDFDIKEFPSVNNNDNNENIYSEEELFFEEDSIDDNENETSNYQQSSDNDETPFEEDSPDIIEKNIFSDDNIEETLRKYNYDYKFLLRELTSFIEYSELIEILNECKIKKVEYLNPTYETFDIIREYIMNHTSKSK